MFLEFHNWKGSLSLYINKIAALTVSFCLLSLPSYAAGQQAQSFEVVSIKKGDPLSTDRNISVQTGSVRIPNQPIRMLLRIAFHINSDDQLINLPSWVNDELYTIEARESEEFSATFEKTPYDHRLDRIRLLVQQLLTDRFHLKYHRESRQLPVYVLKVAKGGAKMVLSSVPADEAEEERIKAQRGIVSRGPGELEAKGIALETMVTVLARNPEFGGRKLIDETGLAGHFDWALRWKPERLSDSRVMKAADAFVAPIESPDLFTALREQLGLRIEERKAPVDVLVIDTIERPDSN